MNYLTSFNIMYLAKISLKMSDFIKNSNLKLLKINKNKDSMP